MKKTGMSALMAASVLISSLSNNVMAQEIKHDSSKAVASLMDKTINAVDSAADLARRAILKADKTRVGHEALLRAEYVYLTVLYADLIAARSISEVVGKAAYITTGDQAVTQFASEKAEAIVLWSPAAITAASVMYNRFARVTYGISELKGFSKDSVAYLASYAKNPLLSGKTLLTNLKYAGRTLVRATATTANYALIGGALVLSNESIKASLMSQAELDAVKLEIEIRLRQLDTEIDTIALAKEAKAAIENSLK